MLIDAGADVNVQGNRDRITLQVVISSCTLSIAKALFKLSGANFDKKEGTALLAWLREQAPSDGESVQEKVIF